MGRDRGEGGDKVDGVGPFEPQGGLGLLLQGRWQERF